MTKTCVICGRRLADSSCVVVVLTPDEETTLIKSGVKPVAEYVYCRPCWAITQDPEAGARLMRNTSERQMLQLGLDPRRAKSIADTHYTRLVELRRKQRHKTHS